MEQELTMTHDTRTSNVIFAAERFSPRPQVEASKEGQRAEEIADKVNRLLGL